MLILGCGDERIAADETVEQIEILICFVVISFDQLLLFRMVISWILIMWLLLLLYKHN